MTKHELMMEYAKCAIDIEYFARKYCKVWDKKKQQYINFELLPQQIQVLEKYKESNRVLVAKYRQGGITTVTCLYLAHSLIFRKDIKVGVAANKLKLAKESIFYQIASIINNLPKEIFNRIPTESDTKEIKIYNNGATLQAFAASADGLRGFTPDILFIDEAAFLEEGEEFMSSASGTMSAGGQIILNSTPRGLDPTYYARYEGARTGKNNFKVVEINWYEDPRYNEDLIWVRGDEFIEEKDPLKYKELKAKSYKPSSSWFRDMCQTFNNDPRKIAQELENKFLGSGGNLVDEETIMRIEKTCKEPIRTEYDNNFWVWEDPIAGYDYYLSCDVAKGSGDGDYSTIQIFKNDAVNMLLIQVAEYQSRVPLEVMGELCLDYGRKYNNAYVIVDVSGGWGISVVRFLINSKYKKIHYDKPRQNDLKIQLKSFARGELQPGFTMKNGAIRDYVLREFERRLREGEALVYSIRLLSEIKTFVFNENTNRYDHMRSAHDDLLIATGMLFAVYMHSKTIGNELNIYLNYAKSALIRKGDEFTEANRDFQEKMISRDGQDANYERKNDMVKGKDWYSNGQANPFPEHEKPRSNNNPFIFVR
jgi:hypothetical protein